METEARTSNDHSILTLCNFYVLFKAGIATRVRAERTRGVGVREGQEIFLFSIMYRPGSGVHPASFTMGTGDLIQGVKPAGV
jgi:hypothetical protein